jgi:hypothetical protein
MQLTKSFSINFHSKIMKEGFSGTFTTKKLTVGDLSKIGLRKAQLSGGYVYDELQGRGVDPTTNILNEMIAHCEVSIIQSPEWFEASEISDLELLRTVYEEVASFEADFHRPEQTHEEQKPVGSSEDSSSVEYSGGGGPVSTLENLVDKKVPKIEKFA